MSDIIAGSENSVLKRYRDMGDGTWAETIYTSSTAGGISTTARLASAAASTNATVAKASAGSVYNIQGYNAAAYPVYLVLYNVATTPVPGTTTIRKKIPIPAGAAFALDWVAGLYFATGIAYAFTKLAADADTTALVAGDVLQFNLDYV